MGGEKDISEVIPAVSVVIPMRNEEEHIRRCVESLLAQDYPHSSMEILVVDGRSDDGSREVVRSFGESEPRVLLLDNPHRVTPHALNTGVTASSGDVVIILGSHSFVSPDFVRRNIEVLNATGADCVGGRIDTLSNSRLGKIVSLAMSSPFGVGNARFRTSDRPGYVDTVAFGAYRKEVFDRIGLFDEELVKNQDDEFNFRLTLSGGKIYLDPSIRSSYWSRPTLVKLWRQYYQYGNWKIKILKKHGRLPSTRHLAPGAALLLFIFSLLLGILVPSLFWLPIVLLILYLALSLFFTLKIAMANGPDCIILPLAFATLHLSYAIGFIRGLPQLARTSS